MRSVVDRNVGIRRMTVIGNMVLSISGSTREKIYPKTIRNFVTRPQISSPVMSWADEDYWFKLAPNI